MSRHRMIRIVVHGERVRDPLLVRVVELLREQGHDVAVRPTWEAGDAEALATESARLGDDVIVAAGGDGTIHEVVNGVMAASSGASLGFVPLGTANDFVRATSLPLDDASRLASTIGGGEPRPIDVVAAGERYFLNVATGGFAADAAGAASEGLKRALGGIAYLLSGVAHLTAARPETIEVRGPDFDWSGEFYGLAVGNARCAGGGNVVFPAATIDDGMLDVVVLPADRSLLGSTRVGADLRIEAVEDQVLRWQAPWVHVESPEPIRANMDGEPYQINGVRFEVQPGALRAVLPPDAPIFSAPG